MRRVLILILVLGHHAVSGHEPIEGFYAQSRAMLTAAGYRPNELTSLVSAAYDRDGRIVFRATYLLALEKPTPGVLAALTYVSASAEETHAVAAFKALQGFPGTGWQDAAVGRLSLMRYPMVRLQLAAVLARSGRTEGWPFVKASLTPGHEDVVHAAAAVEAFDGLLDETGVRIDAAALLTDVIAGQVSAGPSKLMFLDLALKSVHAARARKAQDAVSAESIEKCCQVPVGWVPVCGGAVAAAAAAARSLPACA